LLPESIVWRKKKNGFNAPSEMWLSNSNLFAFVKNSSILNSIFSDGIPQTQDINLSWRIINIAIWEKTFNISKY
jgi:asparagine synthase (glutamine-hydrolysing)